MPGRGSGRGCDCGCCSDPWWYGPSCVCSCCPFPSTSAREGKLVQGVWNTPSLPPLEFVCIGYVYINLKISQTDHKKKRERETSVLLEWMMMMGGAWNVVSFGL